MQPVGNEQMGPARSDGRRMKAIQRTCAMLERPNQKRRKDDKRKRFAKRLSCPARLKMHGTPPRPIGRADISGDHCRYGVCDWPWAEPVERLTIVAPFAEGRNCPAGETGSPGGRRVPVIVRGAARPGKGTASARATRWSSLTRTYADADADAPERAWRTARFPSGPAPSGAASSQPRRALAHRPGRAGRRRVGAAEESLVASRESREQ